MEGFYFGGHVGPTLIHAFKTFLLQVIASRVQEGPSSVNVLQGGLVAFVTALTTYVGLTHALMVHCVSTPVLSSGLAPTCVPVHLDTQVGNIYVRRGYLEEGGKIGWEE